jgi:tRNA(fMet)-specific endonuclease VapC
MKRFMLDTNIVSHLIKGHPIVAQYVRHYPMNALCISSITKGELLFGLAKRPEAKKLHSLVFEFLKRIDVFPWNGEVAECYGSLRADLTRQGKTLGSLDVLIVAHALSLKAVLITNDQALFGIPSLETQDWTQGNS